MLAAHPNFHAKVKHPACKGVARQYNGSICAFNGAYLYAWRREWQDGRSDLGFGSIDPKTGKVKLINAITPVDGHWLEDPRLFINASGVLCILAAEVDPQTWMVRQCLLDPHDKEVVSSIRYLSPANRVEKNWTPISNRDEFLYLPHDDATIASFDDVAGHLHVSGPVPYSGGSPALKIAPGHYLHIWHASGPHPTRNRTYWFGAAIWSETDGKTVQMSLEPLVAADDSDPAIPCPRTAKYNPSVVFPCGLANYDHGFLVSAGVQDSGDYLFFFRYEDFNLVPARLVLDPGTSLEPGDTAPAGMIAVVASSHLFEAGHRRAPGDRFLLNPERLTALGNLVSPC